MPDKNSNSTDNQAQQSNAENVKNNYGEQSQGVFDELTEKDDESGLTAALTGANSSFEGSVFDDEDQDDLYDDEYNYEDSYEEDSSGNDGNQNEEDSSGNDGNQNNNSSENTDSCNDNTQGDSGIEADNEEDSGARTIYLDINLFKMLLDLLFGGKTPASLQDLGSKDDKADTKKNKVPAKKEAEEIIEETTGEEVITDGVAENTDDGEEGNVADIIEGAVEEEENTDEAEGLSLGSLEPIEGVVFDNIAVKKGEGLSLEGTADLKINIPSPEISGEAPAIKITFDPATKSVSFLAESITLQTALGDVEISELSIVDSELKATEAKFTFDSSKTTLGALVSGDTESKYSDIFSLGVVVEIIGHDISISKEKGFDIGEMEKHLLDLKLRVFGEDFEYDAEEGQASLQKEIHLLEFLTSESEIKKEMKVPIFPGVEADFEAGLSGDDTAVLDIVIEKPEDDYQFTITGDLGGLSLSAYVKGEAAVGLAGLAKASANLDAKGDVTLENSSLEAAGSFEAEGNTGIITPKPSSFDLSAKIALPIILNLILNLKASALFFFKKEYNKEIEDFELARFDVDKSWNWKASAEELSGDISPDELISGDKVNPILEKPSNFLSLF